MTAAFDKFMKQYHMTGSEKADGYSQDAFVGLDWDEKVRVFELLVTELPFSAKWLFFLDAQKAIPVVKKKEAALRGNGYAHVYMLQEGLIEYTGDLSYQKNLIEDYSKYVDYLRPLVVDSIGRTPVNIEIVEFLKQVILTEVNADAVARAARRLLMVLKIPRATESDDKNYRFLVSELRNEDPQVKMRALRRISKYESNLGKI